jgi:hypothetical protein
VSEFLSLRSSNRPRTQEDVERYVADEPDRKTYGGAGSMGEHMRRAASQKYRPESARARLAGDRKPVEPESLSPEDEARILAEVDKRVKSDEFKEYFREKVLANVPLEDAWRYSGMEGECPFFVGVERDGDPTGAPRDQITAAWRAMAQSEIFAPYAYTPGDTASGRYKVAALVYERLYNFMNLNLVNMTLVQSWAFCLGRLNALGVLPAPIPTDAQLLAADAAKPASDGRRVVLHDAGPNEGKPVTYTFKDGRVVRYSQAMLDALTPESYAKVMGLERINPQATRTPRNFEPAGNGVAQTPTGAWKNPPADDGNPVAFHDDGKTPVTYQGKRYSKKMLNAVTSDEYLQIFKLSRAPMTMAPVKGL